MTRLFHQCETCGCDIGGDYGGRPRFCSTACADAATMIKPPSLEAELEHWLNLAIVDPGANPTVTWKERAEKAESDVERLREVLLRLRPVCLDPKEIDAALEETEPNP